MKTEEWKDVLDPWFNKIVDNYINYYDRYETLKVDDKEDIKKEALKMLYISIFHFNPEKGNPKGYFGVVAKSVIIDKVRKTIKEKYARI